MVPTRRKRGRPPKFGQPSQVVALTLPQNVVAGLRRIHEDIAWAIVRLFEQEPRRPAPRADQPEAELVSAGDGQSLIAVNRRVIRQLPGVQIIPLQGTRAFLALEPPRGLADLEVAVIDRLEDRRLKGAERRAVEQLRSQLRRWRRDRALRFSTRTIIVVDRGGARAGKLITRK